MKIKYIISKILFLILFINILFPISTYAIPTDLKFEFNGNNVTLYNPIELIDGKYFISIDDLSQMNINHYYNNTNYSYTLSYNDKNLCIWENSSIIQINNMQLLYNNPQLKINGRTYFALDLAALAFGDYYNIDKLNKIITLNTQDSNNTFSGNVYLPNNEVAPVGGIQITVFTGDIISSPVSGGVSSGGGSGKPSRPGYTVGPTNESKLKIYNVLKLATKNYIIPEGKNFVSYTINCDYPKSITTVGYTINDSNYFSGYYQNGETVPNMTDINNSMAKYNVNMTILKKISINGRILLPEEEVADKNITATVTSYNNNFINTTQVVIPMGSSAVPYSISAPKSDNPYEVSVIFDNNYLPSKYPQGVNLNYNNVYYVDLLCDRGKNVSGNLQLPNNEIANQDIEIKLTLQNIEYPYSYMGTQNIIIKNGTNNTPFTITTNKAANNCILFYEIINNSSSYYNYGHYNESGSYINVFEAKQMAMSSDISNLSFELIKVMSVTANVSLPQNMTANEDIYGYFSLETIREDVYGSFSLETTSENSDLLSIDNNSTSSGAVSGGSGGGSSSSVIIQSSIILKGENSGIITAKFPIEKGKVYRAVIYSAGDDRFYDANYFRIGKTTSIKYNATPISENVDSVNIELLKANYITGVLNSNSTEIFKVIAIPQYDINIRTDIYHVPQIFETQNYPSETYKLKIPEDIENYILAFTPYKDEIKYYSDGGLNGIIENSTLFSNTNNYTLNDALYNLEQKIYISSILDVSGKPFSIRDDVYNYVNESFNIHYNKIGNINTVKFRADFYNNNGLMYSRTTGYEDIYNTQQVASLYFPNVKDFGITKVIVYALDENSNVVSEKYVINLSQTDNYPLRIANVNGGFNVDKQLNLEIYNGTMTNLEKLKMYVCYYDVNNRLVATKITDIPIILSQTSKTATISFADTDLTKANNLKIFVWDEKLKPQTEVHIRCNTNVLRVFVNNSQVQTDVPITLIEGSLIVPLRLVAEACGANVSWNQETETVTIEKDAKIIEMKLYSQIAIVNGEEITLSVAPQIINGRTVVPGEFIFDYFGNSFSYDYYNNILYIN